MKNNLKYSIPALIFYLCVLAYGVFFTILLMRENMWRSLVGFVFVSTMILLLLHTATNVQWFKIKDGNLTVYCLFGVLKRTPLNQIQYAFKVRASVLSFTVFDICKPQLVLALNEQINYESIVDAYVRKQRSYIILPHINQSKICEEYNRVIGNMELEPLIAIPVFIHDFLCIHPLTLKLELQFEPMLQFAILLA